MDFKADLRKWTDIAVICLAMLVVFFVVNIIHFRFFEVSVILYSCIVDIIIAAVIVVPIAYWYYKNKRQTLNSIEFSMAFLLASSALTLYAVMGPTVIDRSLSIYIVEKLNQRGGDVAFDAFEDIFVKEYMPEYSLVDVRLTEQFASGTVRRDGECVVLTERGKSLANFMNGYRRLLLPRKRNLMGEITDRLTRPFDNTEQVVDVSCNRATKSAE